MDDASHLSATNLVGRRHKPQAQEFGALCDDRIHLHATFQDASAFRWWCLDGGLPCDGDDLALLHIICGKLRQQSKSAEICQLFIAWYRTFNSSAFPLMITSSHPSPTPQYRSCCPSKPHISRQSPLSCDEQFEMYLRAL